jgi:hypothetical protein
LIAVECPVSVRRNGWSGSGSVRRLAAMNGCNAAIAAVRAPLINGRVRPKEDGRGILPTAVIRLNSLSPGRAIDLVEFAR